MLRMEGKARGPSPSYTQAHLLLALLMIGEKRTVGRQALAVEIGLGEGAIRTIIKKLKHEGHVRTGASGCSLTKKGAGLFRQLRATVSKGVLLDSTPLTVGGKQVAVLIKGAPKKVRGGIEQRDAAVKVGASGATTYTLIRLKFQISGGSEDCERDFPSTAWRKLRKALRPRNGDIVILCGSGDYKTSEVGALSAALTLLR